MIEINGMAHVVLTVSRFDEARAFYCELLPFLGMHKVFDGNHFVYSRGRAHRARHSARGAGA